MFAKDETDVPYRQSTDKALFFGDAKHTDTFNPCLKLFDESIEKVKDFRKQMRLQVRERRELEIKQMQTNMKTPST